MYSQRHVPEGTTTRLAGVKAEAFKVQHGRTYMLPGFEGFCGGSWWDVDVIEQRDKYYRAKYLSESAEEDESWLPLRHLRLRTRKADDWDCHILTRGMDISVFGIHSAHEDLILDPNALYDAKITQLSRAAHDTCTRCTCRFHVNFFSVSGEEEDPRDRRLLSRLSATREVDISHVSLLQQPVNLTVEEILRSHMFEKWLKIQWSNDAFFLPETKLTVDDEEDDNSTDALPRCHNLGVSSRRSRGPTSVLHEKDTSAASKGKSHASSRDRFDHEHKFDTVNQTTGGLKRRVHDLRPDVRGNTVVRQDGSEERDDLLDQHGTRTCVSGGEDDYDAVTWGLGVGGDGIVYGKSGKEMEEAMANVSELEKEHERFWAMRPDDFDTDRCTTRHDNLVPEGRRKSGRGDFAESAGKREEEAGANASIALEKYHHERFWNMRHDFDPGRATTRHDNLVTEGRGKSGRGDFAENAGKGKEEAGANASIGSEKYHHERFWNKRRDLDSDRGTTRHDNLETASRGKSGRGDFAESAGQARRVDVEPKFAHQNRAETSPELVRKVEKGRDEVRTPLRKKQGFSSDQTGRRYGNPEMGQDTKKSRKSQLMIDTSAEEEVSEYVLGDTAWSDEINVDCQTQPRKRTRYSRDSGDDDDPEVVVKLSKDSEGGLLRRNTPRKTRRDSTHLGSDKGNEDTCFAACGPEERQHCGKNPPEVKARKYSPAKRSDRNPVGPDQGHMSEDKHTGAEKRSPSGRRRGRPRKSTKAKVEASGSKNKETKNSASNKHESSRRKARNDVKDAKNTDLNTESSPNTNANVVIDLEDEDSDEIEDDAPIRTEDLGTERKGARGLKERQRKEGRDSDKVVNQSEGHEGEQGDVILPVRLRSQTSEKKKPLTAGSSLPAKPCRVEVEDGGDPRFAQRPLYLDVLEDSTRNETQVQGGAVAEKHMSHKPGGDLDSDLGSTKYSVSVLEENHAVIDLRDQTVIPLGFPGSDSDAKMGSASEIEIAGEVVVEPMPMDSLGQIAGETVAEHTSADGHNTGVHEALTVLDSPDKTINSRGSGENVDAGKSKLKVDSLACDGDAAICSDATVEKTLGTTQ